MKNLILSAALPLILLAGCGGGSRGTGGQLYEGSVFDRSSRGISGVNVTIVNTGDAAVTAADGHFSISTPRISGDVEFILEGRDFKARSAVAGVPATAIRLKVDFVVGSGAEPTVDNSLEVEKEDNGGGDSGDGGHGADSGDGNGDGGNSGDDGGHDSGGGDNSGDGGGSSGHGDGGGDGSDGHDQN